ncbi:putative disease resistance protein RGA1 [Arachis hypogaea]|uniref:Disease resistance protein n=1 Tax=Arachis hypogaea TaxID=3818 RepID=A0A6B9VB51_ARAHY|nr:Putative disease resistance protein [Arachis hypogaea]
MVTCSMTKKSIKMFKQVLHDSNDLLDDVFIEDLCHKANGASRIMSKVCGFYSISHNPIVFRAKLAHKIENIWRDFNSVAEDMSKLNLNRSLVILKQDESAWRETSSFVLHSEIIGREENKSDIVNSLKQTHPDQSVSLVVIIGMGV